MLKKLEMEEDFDFFLQNNRDKLVLVKFFATWCSPCWELQRNLEKLLREKLDLIVLEVDIEKFPQLVQRPNFSVRAVPTIFLFQRGEITKKFSGSMNVEQLQEFIK